MSDEISAECYGCEKPFKEGDAVRISKKYPDCVVFHIACREAHRDYFEASWPVKDIFDT